MKTNFFCRLTFCTFLSLLTACEKDTGIGQFDYAVIEDDDNPNKFSQLTFILSLNNPDNGYLNIEVIDSIELYVNAKYWGTFSSEPVDTSGNTDRITAGRPYSDKPISYLIVAPYQLKTNNLETAGDFVNYLNDRIVLTPGGYICEIRKIQYKDLNGNWLTEKPHLFANFSVIENTSSSYLGNINIPVE